MPQKIVHRNIFHPFALLVALGILFAATNVKAQYTQFSQRQLAAQERQMVLTPEQEETVRLLREQLIKSNGGWICSITRSNLKLADAVDELLKDIDPILVGQNVVFSNKWSKHVGSNRALTRQQFERFRVIAEAVYGCFEELTGGPPNHGKAVLIDLYDKDGWAHALPFGICYQLSCPFRAVSTPILRNLPKNYKKSP